MRQVCIVLAMLMSAVCLMSIKAASCLESDQVSNRLISLFGSWTFPSSNSLISLKVVAPNALATKRSLCNTFGGCGRSGKRSLCNTFGGCGRLTKRSMCNAPGGCGPIRVLKSSNWDYEDELSPSGARAIMGDPQRQTLLDYSNDFLDRGVGSRSLSEQPYSQDYNFSPKVLKQQFLDYTY